MLDWLNTFLIYSSVTMALLGVANGSMPYNYKQENENAYKIFPNDSTADEQNAWPKTPTEDAADTFRSNEQIIQDIEQSSLLRRSLIYKYALELKQINRITYFTCQKPAAIHRSHNSNTKEQEEHYDNVYHHMHSYKLMQCLHDPKCIRDAARPCAPSSAPDTAAEHNADTASVASNDNSQGNATGNSLRGNKTSDANATTSNSTVTTTTIETESDYQTANGGSLLIKVLQIDNLINNPDKNVKRYNNNGRNGKSRTSSVFSSVRWLEEALRPNLFHQLVVLDLACGAASRRVLELASNKMYFNTVYHWLLIEDYVLPENAEWSSSKAVNNNDGNDNKYAKQSANQSWNNTKNVEASIEPIENMLQQLNLYVNTELMLARRIVNFNSKAVTDKQTSCYTPFGPQAMPSHNYYKLYDVWNTGLQFGGKLNISFIGNFTHSNGFELADWYRRSTTLRRRMNLQMARVRCLIVVTNKNISGSLEHYITTAYDTHLDSMNRFNYALLLAVRDMFNMSYILSKTSTWGYLKNGKFDGMIGALVRQQADIGGSPIFFRLERAKVVDYTSRTWTSKPCFIFRHPRSTKKDRIVFLQPFSNNVWVLIALCGFATVIILWILTTVERLLQPDNDFQMFSGKGAAAAIATRKHQLAARAAITSLDKSGKEFKDTQTLPTKDGQKDNQDQKHCKYLLCGLSKSNEKTKQRRVGLILEAVLFYIGLICQQGLSFSTNLISGRCIVIISLLFAFSIYQFYSASIVGTLLIEKPKTLRKLSDLTHSSLEIGIEDIVYNRDYFLRTKDPDAIELYAKKVTSVPMTGDQGYLETPPDGVLAHTTTAQPATDAAKAKSYRDILHSHETGAHATTNKASNWYDPEYGMAKVKKGKFAFHIDAATAYKIIADTFNEREICDLSEIELFPPQKCMGIVQKGSPLKKIVTYGLRRTAEVGIMDYQFRIWHSPKPRCTKQIHTDDLQVDLETFASALFVLAFGYCLSLTALALEIVYDWRRKRLAIEITTNKPQANP